MIFSKIFKKFIIFLLTAVIQISVSGANYRLNDHTDIVFSPTAELFASTVMEYFREADLQLTKFFPKKQKREKSKVRKFIINISDGGQNTMKAVQNDKNITIDISGLSPSFQADYTFLHHLFSAAALQVMPYEAENVRTEWRLPHWISLALHAKLRSSFSGVKIVRSSRTIPGMRFFLAQKFFPDLLLIERSSAENMSNIEFFFLQDYCRFIVDICSMYSPRNTNVAGTYLRELYLENVSSDQAVFQRLIIRFLQERAVQHLRRIFDDPSKYSDERQLEIFLKFHADHMAFSYADPAPASYLKKRFRDLLNIRFVMLGPDMKPTGQIIQSTIDQLPVLIRKYPYVKNVMQLKKGELLHFRSIASSFFSDEINHLIEMISNVEDSWLFGTTQKEIQSAIKKVEDKIKEFAAVEKYLEEAELEKLSPFQIFPYEFSIEKEHRNVTVPSSWLQKLEESEKSYLK